MARYLKIIVAVLGIICVLAICIAPNVHLPVTVIQPLQVILLVLTFSLITVTLVPVSRSRQRVRRMDTKDGPQPPGRPQLLPTETHCVQRC